MFVGYARRSREAPGNLRTCETAGVRKPRPSLIGGSAEGILHVLAGLLDVCLALIGAAVGLKALVVGRLAEAFLGLAREVLSSVLDLVVCTHDGLLHDCRAVQPA